MSTHDGQWDLDHSEAVKFWRRDGLPSLPKLFTGDEDTTAEMTPRVRQTWSRIGAVRGWTTPAPWFARQWSLYDSAIQS